MTIQDFFIGDNARKLRGILKLCHPMRHGIVTDWQDMTHLWRHAYQELNVVQEEVHHGLTFHAFDLVVCDLVCHIPRVSPLYVHCVSGWYDSIPS